MYSVYTKQVNHCNTNHDMYVCVPEQYIMVDGIGGWKATGGEDDDRTTIAV